MLKTRELLNMRNTPAVTMVALCKSADTGVGPSIASVTTDEEITSGFSYAAKNRKKLKVQLLRRLRE